MSTTSRNGHVINIETGEVLNPLIAVVDELEERITSLTKVIRDRDRVITVLRSDLATAMGEEPEADNIVGVLDYWANRVVELGWWSRRPISPPASDRWRAVRARLAEGRSPEYIRLAVDGALLQKKERTKREYVDIASICKPRSVEWNYERLKDPRLQWVRPVQEAPVSLRERWLEVVDLADMCDCGHIRLDHQRFAWGQEPECLVHGCHCEAFDDLHASGGK